MNVFFLEKKIKKILKKVLTHFSHNGNIYKPVRKKTWFYMKYKSKKTGKKAIFEN